MTEPTPFASLPSGPLILASSSHTRQALLAAAGIDLRTAPVAIDEASIRTACAADHVDPVDVAIFLAEMKGTAACQRHAISGGQLVLAADQILVLDGHMFGKPDSRDAAHDQLSRLQGQTHSLITAVVMFRDSTRIWHHVDTARLKMRALDDDAINDYLDVVGSAAFWGPGSYQVEGAGIHLMQEIDGSHTSILGLPMLPILAFLREHGLTLDTHGRTSS